MWDHPGRFSKHILIEKENTMDWKEIKQKGAGHYKTKNVELIDILKAGDMLQDFALGNIMKYAYRNRKSLAYYMDKEDLEKIIHYTEMLDYIRRERLGEVLGQKEPLK